MVQNTQNITERLESNDDFLFIKLKYKLVRTNLNNSFYFEGLKKYVRIHRSYIVNLEKASTIQRFRIVYNDKTRLPVSDNYKEKFQEFLDKNFMG